MESDKQLVDVNEALKIAVEGIRCGWFTEEAYDAVAALLGETPTVNAVEVVHGRWVNEQNGFMYYDAVCSVCGGHNSSASNYCPDCGAKMEANK